MRGLLLLVVLVGLGACVDNTDPEWQLDHDRIIAVRATPPHIPAGGTSTLDAMLAHKGAKTTIEPPVIAGVAPTMPAALMGAVVQDPSSGAWTVVAPDEATLDLARMQTNTPAGMPVVLVVTVAYGPTSAALVATKEVTLGDSVDNPTLGAVTVDGAPATTDSDFSIGADVDVPLMLDAPMADTVSWLTSCGTMHDDNEHDAFIHVEVDDPFVGELAVVDRTPDGGVAFEAWPIHAPPPATGSNK